MVEGLIYPNQMYACTMANDAHYLRPRTIRKDRLISEDGTQQRAVIELTTYNGYAYKRQIEKALRSKERLKRTRKTVI